MDAREDATGDGGAVVAAANEGPPAAGVAALVERLGADVDRLREQVARNDVAIATLHDTTKKKRPWYLEIGPLISLVALLLSFSTTYYSCRQAEAQRLHDARVELRGLLQRLSEIPRQSAALIEQYRDPMVIGQISTSLGQENKLLALHAAELMDQLDAIDAAHVTTSDYILVATAMFNASLISEGIALLDRAEREIHDAQDGATIYRSRGTIRFQMGDLQDGRADFLRALAVFQRFPTSSPYVEATTHAITEGTWALAELNAQQCQEAETHLRRAFAHLAPYVHPSVANPLMSQLRQVEAQMATCGSSDQTTTQMGLEIAPLVAPLVNRPRPDSAGQ